jgi:hypothetical protein
MLNGINRTSAQTQKRIMDNQCCMRMGPRYDIACANIKISAGLELPCVNEIRYLGLFFTTSTSLRFSFDYAERSFYRPAIPQFLERLVELHQKKLYCIY